MEFQRVIWGAVEKLSVIDSEGHQRDVAVSSIRLDALEVRQGEPLEVDAGVHLWVTGW